MQLPLQVIKPQQLAVLLAPRKVSLPAFSSGLRALLDVGCWGTSLVSGLCLYPLALLHQARSSGLSRQLASLQGQGSRGQGLMPPCRPRQAAGWQITPADQGRTAHAASIASPT